MASSWSVIRSQAPAKCGICDTDRSIKWKCIDCSRLMCNRCKEKIHPEFRNSKDHQVVNIKDVGQQTVVALNIYKQYQTELSGVVEQPSIVELQINKEYQTELSGVVCMSYCDDDSLWICTYHEKVLQRVKPEGTKLNILSNFNIKVVSMAVTQSSNLLITTVAPRLQEISSNTGTLTDSVYDVSPFIPTAVHCTSDNTVLVAGVNKDYPYPGRRVVILMNQNGDHERVYEHDQHNQPILTNPKTITTSTSNGNIHVVDRVMNDRGRVVVLGQGGDIINIYEGDIKINKVRPFMPRDIVTTPRYNVIVADPGTNTLHILNNTGLLMTSYKTSDINIMFPMSLAFTQTGKVYIGCFTTDDSKAKIYEVTMSGC
ncbi:uncharacterized protein LOC134716790 [Mytilus trossulus]|uniref:uncharacterized protein LOC134716790 n=1 Tax=Mytilus trossulus TaxID=6551 RepID=UPI00300535E5